MVEEQMCEEEDMRPSFYKIIHHNLNTTQHLRLPHDFLKHTTKDESEEATLEVPTGRCWVVKVSKTADNTFLRDGWEGFVRDHSLGDYEFLVFKYGGAMRFNVRIFDKTGCEIRYGGEKLDTPMEKLYEPVAKNRRGRPPKKLFGPLFKRRGRGRPPKTPESINTNQTSSHVRGPSAEDVEAKAKASNAALSFTSNCPYFLSYLTASSLKHPYFLKVPAAFANTHFPKCKTKVVLRDPRGEAWLVNFLPGVNLFGRGWSAFLYDNQLGEGDICVFELVGQLKLRVHIFSYQ